MISSDCSTYRIYLCVYIYMYLSMNVYMYVCIHACTAVSNNSMYRKKQINCYLLRKGWQMYPERIHIAKQRYLKKSKNGKCVCGVKETRFQACCRDMLFGMEKARIHNANSTFSTVQHWVWFCKSMWGSVLNRSSPRWGVYEAGKITA